MTRSLVKLFALFLLFSGAVFAEEKPKKLIEGYTNETKAGVVIVTGNSTAQTFDFSQKGAYEWNANKVGLLGTYLRSTSKGIESARRWSLGLRYDRELANRWAIFVGQKVEGDAYAGYLQRYSTDIGGKYFVAKEEANTWFFEAGYRFQRENQITGIQKDTSLSRIYTEYEHRWNPNVTSKLWLEYLQNLTTGDDRYYNGELSVKASLTEIFSLQLAYLVRYRNLLPAAVAYKTDTTLTAAVIAQF